MMKKATLAVLALALCAVAVGLAAPPPQVSGKVIAVEDGKVQLAIDGDKPAWLRKNAPVKLADGVGKVLEVSADDVTPVVVTIKTKLASTMKVGDVVTFEKGKSMAGC